jgi:5-methyltetrahydropteroyltriglutamate--homocysteine methyltransferase
MAGVRPVRGKADDKLIMESVLTRELAKAAYELPSGEYPKPGGLRWVVDGNLDIGRLQDNWVEAFKIAQSSTDRVLKFSGPSAAMAAAFSINKTSRNDRDVYFEFFTVQNKVLRELVKAGCKIIQLDYPFGLAHWAANRSKVKDEMWSDLIEAANQEIEGVNAQIWYHFCFGAPVLWGDLAVPMKYSIAETYRHMGDSKCDLLQSEAANTRGEFLESDLAAWKQHCPDKEVAVGVVTPYSGLETVDDVDKLVQKALKYVPADRLALTSDEGLAAHGLSNRDTAMDKMRMIVAAAQRARKNL